MFDLYQLEQLVAIAENGTLSKAAEEMHLSQPALSRSMQKLESELDLSLFDRQKNKLTLNENGILAVQYARNVITESNNMISKLRAFERSHHTINVGSCAPAPLWELTPLLSRLYPEMTIMSEMKDIDVLLQGLQDNTYQIIITTEPISDDNMYSFEYFEEQLYISLPPAHPLCGHQGVYMKDLDGQSILLFSKIGFWNRISRKKMPNTHFLVQEYSSTFTELIHASAFPSFTSDIVMKRYGTIPNRIILPILDSEAHVTFYCSFNINTKREFPALVSELEKYITMR